MIEITLEDAKNILILTDKVQISGREAMYIAQLQIKLQKGIDAETPAEEKKEEKKKS